MALKKQRYYHATENNAIFANIILSLHIYRNRYRRCSVRKMFLEILQNSQENTYARVFCI